MLIQIFDDACKVSVKKQIRFFKIVSYIIMFILDINICILYIIMYVFDMIICILYIIMYVLI